MPEETQNVKPVTQTPFERQLGHIINAVVMALLFWFGTTAISTSTDLNAAKERLISLEKSVNEVKEGIQQGTKDRFTRAHADAALKDIRAVQRGHEGDIAYLKGIVETLIANKSGD